ncbi:hypothetical protein ElyMa_005508500 [Elysia marginata]|uniref:EF-hand domain-containing protein n=1 Tax=Elysia marginata TaxID=1093978 RepID=A0AAV4EUC1_9GAST|nr:hypothetical protein ElyMa_005508500 [Elysia marginata]
MRTMISCSVFALLILLQLHTALSRNIYGLKDYGQRTVSDRLQSLGRAVDVDKDDKISPKELFDWARTLGRPDDDDAPEADELNCVEQSEFVAGMVKAGFSKEFAANYDDFLSEYSAASASGACTGLDTQAVLDDPTKGKLDYKVSEFLAGFLKKLTDFCEDTSGDDLYSSNKDCTSLPNACASEPYGCERVCLQYTFVTTRGRHSGAFSERSHHQAAASTHSKTPKEFAKKVLSSFKDLNNDKTFSEVEQKDDLEANFDTNDDDCVDEAEYKARMSTSLCGGFAFSDAYASAKFEKLRGKPAGGGAPPAPPKCTGIDLTAFSGDDVSKTDFINNNVQLLINLCEGDKMLYTTNEDCKQLSLSCRVEEATKDTDACKKYVEDSTDDDVQDTAVKFFKFLSKWGETYDDFFGPDRRKIDD